MTNLFFFFFWYVLLLRYWGSQVELLVKNLPASAGDRKDSHWAPRSGKSPGGRQGNLLQYTCLENPKDRGAWQAAVHRTTQSQTWLKWLSTHACTVITFTQRKLKLRVLQKYYVRYWARLACECPGVSGRGLGWQWPATESGALTTTVVGHTLCWRKSFWRRSLILPLPSVWPNYREGTQHHQSAENWIEDLLSMALPTRTE